MPRLPEFLPRMDALLSFLRASPLALNMAEAMVPNAVRNLLPALAASKSLCELSPAQLVGLLGPLGPVVHGMLDAAQAGGQPDEKEGEAPSSAAPAPGLEHLAPLLGNLVGVLGGCCEARCGDGGSVRGAPPQADPRPTTSAVSLPAAVLRWQRT